ncbi:glutaredoxin family protein [Marinicella sp. W31]|uniref:glutaredoxin family protein n=1 Tax=Marinicella sp. W31 TaxID=3023713 RepID=UPI003757B42D
MKELTLYSRIECPLCEYAESMLLTLGISYRTIDIDEKTELMQQYHTRIPVIANAVQELGWPFDEQQIQTLAGIA